MWAPDVKKAASAAWFEGFWDALPLGDSSKAPKSGQVAKVKQIVL
jgi:hypothetical protein